MLQTLAYLLIVTASTGLAGLAVWQVFNRVFFKKNEASLPSLGALCLFGLGAQMMLASWWVLFFPLSDAVCAGLIVLPFWTLSNKTRLQFLRSLRFPASWPPLLIAAFSLYALGLILKAASPTEIFDDGIAHLPVIASIRQAGTVIGLANLHPNFGYNTHSTLAQALYSLDWVLGQPLYAFNAWLALVCGGLLFSVLGSLRSSLAALGIGFGLLPLFVLRSQITGMSTDPGHYLLAWTILAEWALGYQRANSHENPKSSQSSFLWFGWIVALAITFKINALPLGILTLAWLWSQRQRPKLIAWSLGTMMLILLPWLVRNALLTGYLFLLVPQTALPVDWRVPAEVLHRLTEQVSGEIFHESGKGPVEYWLTWAQVAGTTNTVLLVLAAMGIVVLGVLSRKNKAMLPLLITLLAGMALWLITVTEPRYAHAWIMPLALCAMGWLVSMTGFAEWKFVKPALLAFVLAFAFLNLTKSFREFGLWHKVVVRQAPRPGVVWEKRKLQGRAVHLPMKFKTECDDRLRVAPGRQYEVENNLSGCWDTPFPCLYRREDLKRLEWRGESLREGFRFRE